MLLNAATVDAFCRQCGRGGAFNGAPFVTCLEGCCCKSCVIHKNWFSCLPGFISTNLRDEQIDFGLQPYLPGTSSFTKLLSCQHSPSHSALPPPRQHLSPPTPLPPHGADVVFFALVFDCPPWEVPGSGCMWLASAWTRLSPPLLCLHGHAAWELQYPWQCRRCAWAGYLNIVGRI